MIWRILENVLFLFVVACGLIAATAVYLLRAALRLADHMGVPI